MKIFVILMGLACAQCAFATELLLVGGGDLPPEATQRFVAAASGNSKAKILVVTWATEKPDETFRRFAHEFGEDLTFEAVRRPLDANARLLFREQLKSATALFFSGGDQNKIMSEFIDAGNTVRDAVIEFYNSGKPVGGTSAGTAIMSPKMFTGKAAKLSDGLGLLPNTLLDTHFLVRNRLIRLEAALAELPNVTGLGVDENNAVWVTDNRRVEVIGNSHLTRVKSTCVVLLKNGETFEL